MTEKELIERVEWRNMELKAWGFVTQWELFKSESKDQYLVKDHIFGYFIGSASELIDYVLSYPLAQDWTKLN